jgi:transposase
LIEYVVARATACCAGSLLNINPRSAIYYFHRLREIIADRLNHEFENYFHGKIKVDERYFGGQRKGNRGRGATGKIPVFGLLKRGGRVDTRVIQDASSNI